MFCSGVLSNVNFRSEVNLGLPPAEGRDRFARVSSEESMKSCTGSHASGGFSMLNDAHTLTGEVGYVLDSQAGNRLRATAGELGRSLEENLNR